MKKFDLAQSVSVLANIGVIAGIIFLGVELHQNNEQLSLQSRYQYYDMRTFFGKAIAYDEEFAPLLYRARIGEELDSIEQGRIFNHFFLLFTTVQFEYRDYVDDLLTEEELDLPSKRALFMAYRIPACREWNSAKNNMSAEFVEFMDDKIMVDARCDEAE